MKQFFKKVDLRSRKAMVEYLTKHFRYSTMNSWNQSTSYAQNVKIYTLGLPKEAEDKALDLISCSEFYEHISAYLHRFAAEHNYLWQVGFNGKSGGYLVLYHGYAKRSEYKSFCTSCGQRNYKSTEESGNCKCGSCGREDRVDYDIPPLDIGVYPGKPTDMYEDFEDWDIYSIRQRVILVQEFDKLCDTILKEVCNVLKHYEIEDEVVYHPETIKVLREVVA